MKAQKDFYQKADSKLWTGREAEANEYWYQVIHCVDLSREQIELRGLPGKKFALLGYCCDEGVARNQGRKGTAKAPDAVRSMLAKLPNHFSEDVALIDAGNVNCIKQQLEGAHSVVSTWVTGLLQQGFFPVLIGGGHDLAYAHYCGIAKHLDASKKVGIINLDAHFDLRPATNGRNSGTPFYQIAQACKSLNQPFNYFVFGIQRQANTRSLFEIAKNEGVAFLDSHDFVLSNFKRITKYLDKFLSDVDHIYLTIDLDGFSSAYAPGVSAPSPFGFQPDIVLEVIKYLCKSGKLLSADIVELNPGYDPDNCTARLAARLVDFLCSHLY